MIDVDLSSLLGQASGLMPQNSSNMFGVPAGMDLQNVTSLLSNPLVGSLGGMALGAGAVAMSQHLDNNSMLGVSLDDDPPQPQSRTMPTGMGNLGTDTCSNGVFNSRGVTATNVQTQHQAIKKGSKIELNTTSGVVKVVPKFNATNAACDVNISAFLLGFDNHVIADDWFVFYGQSQSPDGCVKYSNDIITIDLARMDRRVQKIALVLTIHEAIQRNQNFSMLQNVTLDIFDNATNELLLHFELADYYANVLSMVMGELYVRNGQWKFNAVGDGVGKDLAGLCTFFGVDVE